MKIFPYNRIELNSKLFTSCSILNKQRFETYQSNIIDAVTSE